MSTKNIAIATAKGAGLAAFIGLLAVGAYAEAENEARRLKEQAERDLDEYTFSGTRYANESTRFVLKLTGAEHFLHILIEPDEEFIVLDTDLPDVKIGKEIRLEPRWTNDVEAAITRSFIPYRATSRKISFWPPLGDRGRPLTFAIWKKGEYVGRYLPDFREATLEVM